MSEKLTSEKRQEALAFARRYISSWKPKLTLSPDEEHMERAYEAVQSVIGPSGDFDLEQLKRIIDQASTCTASFDGLCWLGAGQQNSEEPTPRPLQEFLQGVLSYKLKRPRQKRGRQAFSILYRTVVAVSVADICRVYDIRAQRSGTTKPGKYHEDSACDIVAEALQKEGFRTATYGEVEGIWKTRRKYVDPRHLAWN
ncbi:hypothetical protein [Paracoccus actinidiae]|uniref:hypothetical protein n=1 Tax=Paracoccus actinidiae TaxID=3064531 RepID=UPI0027D23025|nr:hypothetical protein [Paracoccus sp. M09]